MLLAAFGLPGYVDLHGLNGLKNLHSALLADLRAHLHRGGADRLGTGSGDGGLRHSGRKPGPHHSRRTKRTDLLRIFVGADGAAMTAAFFLL
jgi:hypothetical protein